MKIIKLSNTTESDLLNNYTKFKYQGGSHSNLYISNNKKFILKTNISKKEFENLIYFNKTVPSNIKNNFFIN